MVFSKKWLQNHPQFLLHFLIHIDALMLCRKFDPIPTKNFRVTCMNILKNGPIFEKRAKAIAHGFFPYSFFIIVSRITWARNKINQSKGEKKNEKTDVHVHVHVYMYM